MNNNVHYETAWRFLKSIIEQFKESHSCIARIAAENSSEHHQALGREYMAGLILGEMECMEEGIADAMRGQEADEHVITEEKIRAASDTIDAFLDSLSTEDKGNQEKALSKYIRFLIDERIRMWRS